MSSDLRFASLFSGCGGFDLGFSEQGYQCVSAFEIDPLTVSVHRQNLGSDTVIHDLSNGLQPVSRLQNLDVLLAGSPCQGFSTAGKRQLDDPRNELLLAGGRIALALRPKVFVAENVTGVVAGSLRKYWNTLRNLLRNHGYKTADLRCEATSMGLPQIRRRMVMLAWLDKQCDDLAIPVSDGGVLRDVLLNLDGTNNHTPHPLAPKTPMALIASKIGPRQKLCNVRGSDRSIHTWRIPEVFGKTTKNEVEVLDALMRLRRQKRLRNFGDADPVTASALKRELCKPVERELSSLIIKGYVRRQGKRFDLVHTFNGKYRRLSWDAPSPTVDTRFGDPRYFLHPDENRGLTVREAARIQGFPDSFVFCGPDRAQFRMVGNAVPPPVAAKLAKMIRTRILC